MGFPVLNMIQIVYKTFKGYSVEGGQLVFDGLKISDLFPEFLCNVKGLHIH